MSLTVPVVHQSLPEPANFGTKCCPKGLKFRMVRNFVYRVWGVSPSRRRHPSAGRRPRRRRRFWEKGAPKCPFCPWKRRETACRRPFLLSFARGMTHERAQIGQLLEPAGTKNVNFFPSFSPFLSSSPSLPLSSPRVGGSSCHRERGRLMRPEIPWPKPPRFSGKIDVPEFAGSGPVLLSPCVLRGRWRRPRHPAQSHARSRRA